MHGSLRQEEEEEKLFMDPRTAHRTTLTRTRSRRRCSGTMITAWESWGWMCSRACSARTSSGRMRTRILLPPRKQSWRRTEAGEQALLGCFPRKRRNWCCCCTTCNSSRTAASTSRPSGTRRRCTRAGVQSTSEILFSWTGKLGLTSACSLACTVCVWWMQPTRVSSSSHWATSDCRSCRSVLTVVSSTARKCSPSSPLLPPNASTSWSILHCWVVALMRSCCSIPVLLLSLAAILLSAHHGQRMWWSSSSLKTLLSNGKTLNPRELASLHSWEEERQKKMKKPLLRWWRPFPSRASCKKRTGEPISWWSSTTKTTRPPIRCSPTTLGAIRSRRSRCWAR